MMLPSPQKSPTPFPLLFLRPIAICLSGLGLSGLGLLGTTAVQAQTNGVEASRLLNAEGLAAVEAPSEKFSEKPSSKSLIAPTAMTEPEPSPPIAVETSPVNQAPDTIVFSDRSAGCDTAMAWGKAVSPLCSGQAQTPVSVSRPEQIERTTADMTLEAESPEAEASEVSAPIQLGPVSVGRSGIQFSAPAALKPYFNGNIKFAKMPNLKDLKMIFPLALPSPITSLFGWRTHPITGEQRMHTGTDIGAPLGTPVLAVMNGRVLLADFLGGYGMAIALEHGQGSQQTLYAHLSELFVKPGEVVQQGTVIGRVGSTGNSTGPHLHFELRQQLPDGSWVAQDSGKALEVALGGLVDALQVTNKPQVLAQSPAIAPDAKTKSLPEPKSAIQPTRVTVLKMQPSQASSPASAR
jgi:murein DD-endopeptidase MepM/ murein hydrolase activator NlpD